MQVGCGLPAEPEGDPLVTESNHTAGVDPRRFLSCRHIQRSLVFYPGKVNACCANPVTGATPTISEFTGGDLAIASIIAGRNRIKERHKAGDIVDECQHCPRLVEDVWEADEPRFGSYPIDEVTIAHFTTCNIRCNYCYTVRNERDAMAPLSKVPRLLRTFEGLVRDRHLAPYATVRFSGGEPTLLPEFEDLLTLLGDYGVRSIVYTNATKYSPAIVAALKKDKVELILGIDAATRKTYQDIKKMDYNEAVWKNVAAYCTAQPTDTVNKVWAKFIFTVENYMEANLFVRRAEAAGVKHVYYDFDSSRTISLHSRGALPEEICGRVAELRYDCLSRGIEVGFAESGLAWLTPERTARIEQAFNRLVERRGAIRPGESCSSRGSSWFSRLLGPRGAAS
jgi:organic radical activating enzyme